MSESLMESANNFASELASYFFDNPTDNEQHMMVQTSLEELANKLGVSVNTLKTWIGFILLAAVGYLLFINLFFFALPFAFFCFFIFFLGGIVLRL